MSAQLASSLARTLAPAVAVLLTCMVAGCSGRESTTPDAALAAATANEVASGDIEVTYTPFPPDSVPARMLADFARGKNVQLVSLEPWDAADYVEEGRKSAPPKGASPEVYKAYSDSRRAAQKRSRAQWCIPGPCIDGNRVLGRIGIDQAEQKAVLAKVLEDWASMEPNYGLSCAAIYHHAVTFDSGSHHYDVLLCYTCGQYAILRDGERLATGQAAKASGLESINSWLRDAGLPAFVPDH